MKRIKTLVPRVQKKEVGSAALSRFLPLLIVIVLVSMLLVTFSDYMKILNKKDEINLLMRKYIIRMESFGYLTDSDKADLLEELSGMGITNVILDGTTLQEVEYGAVVTLHIQANMSVDVYSIISAFDGEYGTQTINIDEIVSSTSQQ